MPGNKEFSPGDEIKKPRSGDGQGGKQASDSGDGEDDFEFTMTQDEILDIFFEDLELPNLVRTTLKRNAVARRGGAPASPHRDRPRRSISCRTMRNSFGAQPRAQAAARTEDIAGA